MNGLNKVWKQYRWRKSFYLMSAIYILIVLILAIMTYRMPETYQKLENNRINEIRADLESALQKEKTADLTTALAKIKEKQTVDFAILSEQKFSYATVPNLDFEDLSQWVDDRTLSYHGAYKIKTETDTYQVWLAIYRMEPQIFFEHTLLFLISGVILLFTIVTFLMMTMFKNLVSPIKRLRDNILKLKSYQLTEVSNVAYETEYDALSEELSEFTDDLQGKFTSMGVKYTGLERELQANREKSIYKEQLVSAMIHDLKTPLSISSIQAELTKEEINDEKVSKRMDKIEAKNQEILTEIKDVLTMINNDNVLADTKIETVDIVKVIRETFKRFAPIFEKKDIQYYVEIPREMLVKMRLIELKQILYNIISNVSQYTDPAGMFELSLYEEEGFLHLEAYNDKAAIDGIDFDHVFDLFYHSEIEKNAYSSGIGMYTIQSMVQQYGGVCTFSPRNQGVVLSIKIPMEHVGGAND